MKNNEYDPDEAFKDFLSIGDMEVSEAIEILREIGDDEAIEEIQSRLKQLYHKEFVDFKELSKVREKFSRWRAYRGIWKHTTHEIGYVSPLNTSETTRIQLRSSTELEPDDLEGKNVNITLERVYIKDYPGKSPHNILFNFYTKNSINSAQFIKLFEISEGDFAAINNIPIFELIKIEKKGLLLKIKTVDINSSNDNKFLSFLKSKSFDIALSFTGTALPIIGLISSFALGITKALLERRKKNIKVQDIYLRLSFNKSVFSPKLKEGSYIIVQIPEHELGTWNWNEWVYLPSEGHIIKKGEDKEFIPFNYIVIGIFMD